MGACFSKNSSQNAEKQTQKKSVSVMQYEGRNTNLIEGQNGMNRNIQNQLMEQQRLQEQFIQQKPDQVNKNHNVLQNQRQGQQQTQQPEEQQWQNNQQLVAQQQFIFDQISKENKQKQLNSQHQQSLEKGNVSEGAYNPFRKITTEIHDYGNMFDPNQDDGHVYIEDEDDDDDEDDESEIDYGSPDSVIDTESDKEENVQMQY